MVWTKLSDDFPEDCHRAGLSDPAFRTHVEALCWCMRRENGGLISKRDVDRFADSRRAAEAVEELIARGFWARTEGGYRVEHHMEHQPEPEVIDARRVKTAARVRKHRRKAAGLPSDPDVTPLRDALPGTGRDGTGRASLHKPTTATNEEDRTTRSDTATDGQPEAEGEDPPVLRVVNSSPENATTPEGKGRGSFKSQVDLDLEALIQSHAWPIEKQQAWARKRYGDDS